MNERSVLDCRNNGDCVLSCLNRITAREKMAEKAWGGGEKSSESLPSPVPII